MRDWLVGAYSHTLSALGHWALQVFDQRHCVQPELYKEYEEQQRRSLQLYKGAESAVDRQA